MIHEFFAVMGNSVYIVKDERNKNGCPIVERIAENKKRITPNKMLSGGSHVGIMFTGIVLFRSSARHREPEFNTLRWGDKTSPIVALFLKKDNAMECFNSDNLQNCDKRWKEETLETLDEIGSVHPVFVPSIMEGPSYWPQ